MKVNYQIYFQANPTVYGNKTEVLEYTKLIEALEVIESLVGTTVFEHHIKDIVSEKAVTYLSPVEKVTQKLMLVGVCEYESEPGKEAST